MTQMNKAPSMRTHIERHYGASILAELVQKINSERIHLRFDQRNSHLKHMTVCPGSGSILSISFRRFPGNEVCAKIVMSAKVRRTYSHNGVVSMEIQSEQYMADVWISFERDEIFCDYCHFRNDYGVEDEEGQNLSEYPILYFSREDIEQGAERVLFALCQGALRKPELINAGNLIRLLELAVIRLPLYKREKTQSTLGQLNSDDEYNERILTLSLSKESGAIMKRALAISNALRHLFSVQMIRHKRTAGRSRSHGTVDASMKQDRHRPGLNANGKRLCAGRCSARGKWP